MRNPSATSESRSKSCAGFGCVRIAHLAHNRQRTPGAQLTTQIRQDGPMRRTAVDHSADSDAAGRSAKPDRPRLRIAVSGRSHGSGVPHTYKAYRHPRRCGRGAAGKKGLGPSGALTRGRSAPGSCGSSTRAVACTPCHAVPRTPSAARAPRTSRRSAALLSTGLTQRTRTAGRPPTRAQLTAYARRSWPLSWRWAAVRMALGHCAHRSWPLSWHSCTSSTRFSTSGLASPPASLRGMRRPSPASAMQGGTEAGLSSPASG